MFMYVILGGTSGLGWELAGRLRDRGQRVFVMGREYDSSEHNEGLSVDLFYPESVENAIKVIESSLVGQSVKAFVWAAGYGYRGDFADQPDVRSMAEVNFAGALPIVQWAWRQMSSQSDPTKMVVLGSTSGVRVRPDNAVYVATKHAQTGFARALGEESARLATSVRVHLFVLGGMKTPFWDWMSTQPDDEEYSTFNDPTKVADKIIETIDAGHDYYTETLLEKGTLV